ncbi:MAG: hypothetical protein ACREAA_09415 [Candidatus Polarisedimenticolia bacterium]
MKDRAGTGARNKSAPRAGQQPAQPPPQAPPSPRTVVAIAFALTALAALIAVLTIFKMSNNDIWIHLRTGQNILSTWAVPDKDPYSFSASDHDYVAHEWLSGVVFHLVYAAGGVTGLIFFKSAVIFATCAALLGACRVLSVRLAVALPCFAMMLYIGSARFLERPHIFSYLFEALYILCYLSWRKTGRRAWLYAIPPLHMLWTNMHGGHFQGLAMLVMFALAELVMHLRTRWFGLAREDARPMADVLRVAALLPASLAFALINPYGYRLLTFPFELTGQDVFMKGIYEWQSALFPSYNLSSMFLYYIFWVAVLFGSFLVIRGHQELRGGWRTAAQFANLLLGVAWVFFVYEFASAYKSRLPTLVEQHASLWYVMVGLFLLANTHRLEFHHAGIVALFFAMSMRHNRAVTDAVVATLPTLAHNLNAILDRAGAARWWRQPRVAQGTLYGTGILLAALAWYTYADAYYFGFNPDTRRETGLGIASNMPTDAVDWIEKNHITGRCLPSYNAAAMLIHRMWPDVKVGMDSRNDVYGEALYLDYMRVLNDPQALDNYVKKYDVDFLLLTYVQDRAQPIYAYLDNSPEWTLVYFDDRHVVYLRDRPRFQEIIQRDGYKLITPARSEAVELRQDMAEQWLDEAKRAAAAAPTAWSPLQYLTKAYQVLQRMPEAIQATKDLIHLNPGAYFAWKDLGDLYAADGRKDEALQAYASCLTAQPGYRPCQEALMRLRAIP